MASSINKLELRCFSINVLYDNDVKTRNSFCWKHFGQLILEESSKRNNVFSDQVFCNQCLKQLKEENEKISFGIYTRSNCSTYSCSLIMQDSMTTETAKIKSYAKTVSTGNLLRHLKDCHDIKDEQIGNSKRLISEFFTTRPQARVASRANVSRATEQLIVTKKDKWLLARDLTLWFCRSLMPFDAVSDQGMIDFFKKYNVILTEADLPSRFTISRTALDDVYESMFTCVKQQIAESSPQHVSVTFDLWTDRYRHLNYITFTLHYLTADFTLRSFTLSTKLAQGKKTGELILGMLNKTMAEFGLSEKVLHVVTDAGSNVKRAISLGNLDGHLCLGHGLHNLVTVDGIQRVPEINAVVTKCKKIVKCMRYRLPDLEMEVEQEQRKFLQHIDSIGEDLELDENEPIPMTNEGELSCDTFNDEFGDVNHVPSIKTSTPTRWHSVLAMLESLAHFCNRGAINDMLTKIGETELKVLQSEWNIIEDLIRFLKKFREAVEVLSAQKYASLNLALIFRTELKDVLNAIGDDETLITLSLKNYMISKIDSRFPISDKIVCAALLDCRFSGLQEIDTYLEKHRTTRAAFLSNMIKHYVNPTDRTCPDPEPRSMPSTSASDSSSKQSLLTKLSLKHSSINYEEATDKEFQECWKYLATAVAKELVDELNGDLLAYWRDKRHSFPCLAALARAVLATPATSTASERVFSVAGLVLNAKRSRLNPIRLNKIVFIHDNYEICREYCNL